MSAGGFTGMNFQSLVIDLDSDLLAQDTVAMTHKLISKNHSFAAITFVN